MKFTLRYILAQIACIAAVLACINASMQMTTQNPWAAVAMTWLLIAAVSAAVGGLFGHITRGAIVGVIAAARCR